MRRQCVWQRLPVVRADLSPLLSDPITMHRGPIPRQFLPGGSADLVFAAGAPLPTPWGPDALLIHVNTTRCLTLDDLSAHAFRVPLELGVLRVLCDGEEPVHDGLHRPSSGFTSLFDSAVVGQCSYDPAKVLEVIAEKTSSAVAPLRKRLAEIHEILMIARSMTFVPTVAAWSQSAGVSGRCLERMLQPAGNARPKEFLRVLRLNRAIADMTGEGALVEIADKAGFSDQSHMSRECRTITGSTAVELKASVRSGEVFYRC